MLIADEPTTALDVTIQAQILELIQELKEKLGTAVILITHDLGVVAETAQRVVVMYAGRKVEEATGRDLFDLPLHPYTRGLMAAVPRLRLRRRTASGRGLPKFPAWCRRCAMMPKGCSFAPRCAFATARCRAEDPAIETARSPSLRRLLELARRCRARASRMTCASSPLLEVDGLTKHFPIRGGLFPARPWPRARCRRHQLLDRARRDARPGRRERLRQIDAGETMLKLLEPTAGRIKFDGEDITDLSPASCGRSGASMQVVFQDPVFVAQSAHVGRARSSESR